MYHILWKLFSTTITLIQLLYVYTTYFERSTIITTFFLLFTSSASVSVALMMSFTALSPLCEGERWSSSLRLQHKMLMAASSRCQGSRQPGSSRLDPGGDPRLDPGSPSYFMLFLWENDGKIMGTAWKIKIFRRWDKVGQVEGNQDESPLLGGYGMFWWSNPTCQFFNSSIL